MRVAAALLVGLVTGISASVILWLSGWGLLASILAYVVAGMAGTLVTAVVVTLAATRRTERQDRKATRQKAIE